MLKFVFLFLLPFIIEVSDSVAVRKKSLPLELPVSFAGNYGELRVGRFHAGLDFRVGGRIGDKIYSIDEGYVSRISVSPVGYGNGIYITHPDSTTSVYGHLLDFAPEIAAKVKEIQYSRKCFALNVFFSPDEIPIARHQFIGRVGNTGGSNGPHLHLEVRNPGNTMPINPITNGYVKVEKDVVPPIFQCINFYSYRETEGVVQTALLRSFSTPFSGVVKLPKYSYVAIDAVDKQKNTYAKLAIEEYKVDVDTLNIFKYKVGDFSYVEQNDYNGLIEYSEYIRTKKTMIKSYLEPGHGFAEKIEFKNNGLIILNDDRIHKVTITVCDQYGNKAVRSFKVQLDPADTSAAIPSDITSEPTSSESATSASNLQKVSSSYVSWYSPYVYIAEGMTFSLPAMALFRSIRFQADTIASTITGDISTSENHSSSVAESDLTYVDHSQVHSKIWKLHTPLVPLRASANLFIVADVPDSLQSKALIASISPKGDFVSCGGEWNGNGVSTKIGAFGDYCVVLDTIPPVATPRFKNGANISSSGQLAYTISDELSGIATYSSEVDGRWILAQYDAKSHKLWIKMDREVVEKGKNHSIVLQVNDNKGNTKSVKSTFYW